DRPRRRPLPLLALPAPAGRRGSPGGHVLSRPGLSGPAAGGALAAACVPGQRGGARPSARGGRAGGGRSYGGGRGGGPLPQPRGRAPCFLLAAGTIDPRKNSPRLVAAYRELKARGVEAPLVVAGRVGWAYGSVLDDLKREPGVRLLGHVDDPTLRALYRGAAA